MSDLEQKKKEEERSTTNVTNFYFSFNFWNVILTNQSSH